MGPLAWPGQQAATWPSAPPWPVLPPASGGPEAKAYHGIWLSMSAGPGSVCPARCWHRGHTPQSTAVRATGSGRPGSQPGASPDTRAAGHPERAELCATNTGSGCGLRPWLAEGGLTWTWGSPDGHAHSGTPSGQRAGSWPRHPELWTPLQRPSLRPGPRLLQHPCPSCPCSPYPRRPDPHVPRGTGPAGDSPHVPAKCWMLLTDALVQGPLPHLSPEVPFMVPIISPSTARPVV